MVSLLKSYGWENTNLHYIPPVWFEIIWTLLHSRLFHTKQSIRHRSFYGSFIVLFVIFVGFWCKEKQQKPDECVLIMTKLLTSVCINPLKHTLYCCGSLKSHKHRFTFWAEPPQFTEAHGSDRSVCWMLTTCTLVFVSFRNKWNFNAHKHNLRRGILQTFMNTYMYALCDILLHFHICNYLKTICRTKRGWFWWWD